MLCISSDRDLHALKASRRCPEPIVEYIGNRLTELTECFSDGDCEPAPGGIEGHTRLVLLEGNDDLADLRGVGLNPADRGLFGSVPEAVVERDLGDVTVYHVHILCNNDYMLELIIPKDVIYGHPEGRGFVERWA